MSFIPIDCTAVSGITSFTVQVAPPGSTTPVEGSRWFDTGEEDLALLGITDLTLTSPVPAGDEIVVVDFLSYFAEVTVGLALTDVSVLIRQVSDSTILWEGSIGFTATAGLGSSQNFEQTGLYIFGGAGEQLEMVITIDAGIGVTLATSANFGGFLAAA